jgi:hypothetical protein
LRSARQRTTFLGKGSTERRAGGVRRAALGFAGRVLGRTIRLVAQGCRRSSWQGWFATSLHSKRGWWCAEKKSLSECREARQGAAAFYRASRESERRSRVTSRTPAGLQVLSMASVTGRNNGGGRNGAMKCHYSRGIERTRGASDTAAVRVGVAVGLALVRAARPAAWLGRGGRGAGQGARARAAPGRGARSLAREWARS